MYNWSKTNLTAPLLQNIYIHTKVYDSLWKFLFFIFTILTIDGKLPHFYFGSRSFIAFLPVFLFRDVSNFLCDHRIRGVNFL